MKEAKPKLRWLGQDQGALHRLKQLRLSEQSQVFLEALNPVRAQGPSLAQGAWPLTGFPNIFSLLEF